MNRVRFAPSPTGSLHLGSLRTAIVNFLFAQKTQATLVLRIEDTDKQRSTDESTAVILENLQWMGLSFDEGPFFQSERTPLYLDHVKKLVQLGKAYPCFCTDSDKIEGMIKDPCKNIGKTEAETRIREHQPFTIRLHIPDTQIQFVDLIKGKVSFKGENLEDFIIARTDGSVTYNFAVVVDDHEMGITHVIRGEDHLPNTPKQIALYQAFGWNLPAFAHLPLIIGPDKTKLSKRHCDTAIEDYKQKGYLPETIFNYLALLGYSHDPAHPIQSLDQLIQNFAWEKISRSASQFDLQRLIWMNKQILDRIPDHDYYLKALSWIPDNALTEEKKKAILLLSRNQIRLWSDIPSVFQIFTEPSSQELSLFNTVFQKSGSLLFLKDLLTSLSASDFSLESLQDIMEEIINRMQLKKREAIQWVRIAVTGSTVSPSLYETMQLLGKEEVLCRMGKFLEQGNSHEKQ